MRVESSAVYQQNSHLYVLIMVGVLLSTVPTSEHGNYLDFILCSEEKELQWSKP